MKFFISLLTALLVLITIEKVQDFFSIFNFLWIFPIILFLIGFSFDYRTMMNFDYFFSKKVEGFKEEKWEENGWMIKMFIIENDTTYFSQNPPWEEIYEGEFIITKSNFQNHYHLTKAE